MPIPLIQVDAFSSKPFAGNPAAVCLLEDARLARDERWMQHVAREMNLSETAFLVPRADGHDLRWFTPTIEVDLCGHATLASAHVLWESGRLAPDRAARFHTKSGLLVCERKDAWIEMDFPSHPPREAVPPEGLLESLGARPRFVGRSRFDWFVEVESEEALRSLAPDFGLLRRFETRGTIVTSRAASAGRASSSGPGSFDFVSRFFAPNSGIDEDPVTGSAHCSLAPYWAERLGKDAMSGWQASARGGEVRVRLSGDRVVLSGQAVTVMRGELV
ncbi:MAG: PhzF family phenazine biosynthesis protein [Planctomycetota bacterium]